MFIRCLRKDGASAPPTRSLLHSICWGRIGFAGVQLPALGLHSRPGILPSLFLLNLGGIPSLCPNASYAEFISLRLLCDQNQPSPGEGEKESIRTQRAPPHMLTAGVGVIAAIDKFKLGKREI